MKAPGPSTVDGVQALRVTGPLESWERLFSSLTHYCLVLSKKMPYCAFQHIKEHILF